MLCLTTPAAPPLATSHYLPLLLLLRLQKSISKPLLHLQDHLLELLGRSITTTTTTTTATTRSPSSSHSSSPSHPPQQARHSSCPTQCSSSQKHTTTTTTTSAAGSLLIFEPRVTSPNRPNKNLDQRVVRNVGDIGVSHAVDLVDVATFGGGGDV